MNTSLLSGTIPTDWKQSKVTPLFKDGNRQYMNNYRPISSIPLLAKILEKCVHLHLSSYLETNDKLYKLQFGFRPNKSTTHAVATLLNDMYNATDNNHFIKAIFIDFRKAFNTVNHTILLNKLKSYGIINLEHLWFTNYLSDRSQSTIANGIISNPLTITCGVPQGTTLGPTLFSLYVNDLPNVLSKVKTVLFADDTIIYAANTNHDHLTNHLQKSLDVLHLWCRYNKLSINSKKSQTMSIRITKNKKKQLISH